MAPINSWEIKKFIGTVLAIPVGAVPDLIRDGETGFVLEDNLPEYIAQNVVRALSHPSIK